MPKIDYPAELRKTETGKRLYKVWRNTYGSRSIEFQSFGYFYRWSIATGYTEGVRLYRHDDNASYSPDNCYWGTKSCRKVQICPKDPAWAKNWNRTVNRIRQYCGMDPLEDAEESEASAT